MSLKKIATSLIIGGMAVGLIGCGAKHKSDADNYSDNSSGIKSVSSFDGQGMSAEEELALLNTKVVYFDFDSSNLSAKDERVLSAHAKYMLEQPKLSLRIQGHTDNRGSREYNVALGERRGLSVERFLEARGVPANRLSVVSYGKEMPANPENNEKAWAENRRAELVYEDRN